METSVVVGSGERDVERALTERQKLEGSSSRDRCGAEESGSEEGSEWMCWSGYGKTDVLVSMMLDDS